MTTARIDRMVRELQSEPSLQFFQGFFALGRPVAPQRSEATIPVSLLKHAAA